MRTLDLTGKRHQGKTKGDGRKAASANRIKGRRQTLMFRLRTDLSRAEKQKGLTCLSVTQTRMHL